MFVGRQEELNKLEHLYAQGGFQMVVVYGRRRVGKTTLIREFAKDKPALFFTALEQSDQNNLADFSRAIQVFFELPQGMGSFASWSAAFDYLAQRCAEQPFVLVFDEFPYAALRNESLPSALQIAIDHRFKDTGLFLILCGSNQGFMESEVLGRKSPLYGRRTSQMRILPLDFIHAKEMFPGLDVQDAFRYYGCFGGVPYYLSQVNPSLGFQENLARLYFDPAGFLYEEPMALLRQEFAEPALYSSILRAIAGGANKPNEIANRTGIAQTSLPRYLTNLVNLGIIERQVPFGENQETSRRAIYCVADACYDFWFHFVMPNVSEIEKGLGRAVAGALSEAELDDYLGHRFERVCKEWLVTQAIAGSLPIPATAVDSWWGTDAKKRVQTDIDVLAADKKGRKLLIGECKYHNAFNVKEAVRGLQEKHELVAGYDVAGEYVFSKLAVPESASQAFPEVRFVTLEDIAQ